MVTAIAVMNKSEFDALPEYSVSLPTGATIGKRWKRKCKDGWLVGEYAPDPEPGYVQIKWKRIQLQEEQ